MEEKSLIGRWLKCIKDDAFSTDHKVGDYIQLIRKAGKSYESNKKSTMYGFLWSYPSDNFESNGFELMPEGFHPDNVNSEFVLPEKWYVKFNSETKELLNYYRTKIVKYSTEEIIDGYKTILCDGSGAGSNPYWYTEITFDQFKKYVLKESNVSISSKDILDLKEKPIEINNEYLTVHQLVKGEYYYAISHNNIHEFIIKNSDNKEYIFDKYFCSGFSNLAGYKYKKATFSARQWLEKCIKANKFIPKEEALKSNKKYTISELKANTNLVVRCTKPEQVDKIAPLIQTNVSSGSIISHYKDVIIFQKSGFNKTKDKYSYQTMIEYDDVIFENDKPGINTQSFKDVGLTEADFSSLYDTKIEYSKCPPIDSNQYNWELFGESRFTSKNLGLREYPLFESTLKSNDLEFQQPVIIKNKNKKSSKLIIINQ